MKLGILVVYLVSERNERLLDIHLEQIEKHTSVPYTIYGSSVRLLPQFVDVLHRNPRVTICPCQPYEDKNPALRRYEHSWYLEQLIRFALDDGATHVVILHVDSFPVRDGWARELAARLTDHCVLAGILRDEKTDRKPMSACIFFAREFYLKYQARLLLSVEEAASPEYAQYREQCPHGTDSGVGYGFSVYKHGLSWYPLTRSNKGSEHELFGSIYGDMIFHLHSAMQMENSPGSAFSKSSPETRNRVRRVVGAAARAVLGRDLQARIRGRLPPSIREPEEYRQRQAFEGQRHQLLENTEAYLHYLRTGQKPRRGSSTSRDGQARF